MFLHYLGLWPMLLLLLASKRPAFCELGRLGDSLGGQLGQRCSCGFSAEEVRHGASLGGGRGGVGTGGGGCKDAILWWNSGMVGRRTLLCARLSFYRHSSQSPSATTESLPMSLLTALWWLLGLRRY
jgi:hypothetical protein